MSPDRTTPAHMLPRHRWLRSTAERAVFGAAAAMTAVGLVAATSVAAPPIAVASTPKIRMQRVALPPSSSTSTSAPSTSTTAAPDVSASLTPAPLLWPVRGQVTSEYAERAGRLHAGLDISAPEGTPIVAARAGRVGFVGRQNGYGNIVIINHGERLSTAYPHQSAFATRVGALVNAGDLIGYVGCTGNCTGPHLHFETRVNGVAQNPRRFLPSRLFTSTGTRR